MPTASSNGVTADKIFNDPNFERTRENMAEFGRASKASVLIREIFRDMTVYAKDKITHTRLSKVLSRVIAADTIGKRGERTVSNGDLQQLRGFHFNGRAPLRESLYARCAVTIDRATGMATITIPSFVPKVMVAGPRGTSHYKIVAGVTAVNFDTEQFAYMRVSTDEIGWDQVQTTTSSLVLPFPANSPDTIIVALGIEFYQGVNGVSYALKTGQANATTIVAVDKP